MTQERLIFSDRCKYRSLFLMLPKGMRSFLDLSAMGSIFFNLAINIKNCFICGRKYAN